MLVSEVMVLTDGPMAGMVLDTAGVAGVTQGMDGVTQDTDGVTRDTDGVTQDTDGATRDTDGDITHLITQDIRVITALVLMVNDMHTIQGEMRVIRDLTQETSALKTNLMRQEGLLLQETWPRHMIRTETELPTEAAVLK